MSALPPTGQLPPIHGSGDRVVTPDFASVVRSERQHRDQEKMFGGWDMLIALKSIPAAGLMEVLQTEAAQQDAYGGSQNTLLGRVAEAPFDWKAIAVSAGVYAVGSAAARINNRTRLDVEVTEAVQQMHEGGQLTTYTEEQLQRNRFVSKVRRAALTAAGCVVAYKVGEYGSTVQDMVAGGGLATGAMASVAVVNARSRSKIDRILSGRRRGTDLVPVGDYIDGNLARDRDRSLPGTRTKRKSRRHIGS